MRQQVLYTAAATKVPSALGPWSVSAHVSGSGTFTGPQQCNRKEPASMSTATIPHIGTHRPRAGASYPVGLGAALVSSPSWQPRHPLQVTSPLPSRVPIRESSERHYPYQ